MITLPDELKAMNVIGVDDVPDDLKRYIVKPEAGWTWFHHPALILHLPSALPMPLADAVALRQREIDDALKAGEWERYVFRHERPYRFDALDRIAALFEDQLQTKRGAARFWRLAAEVWIDGEHDEASDLWTNLMDSPVPWRGFMTTGPERRALRRMAGAEGRVRVFRGVQARNRDDAVSDALGGWSWTASRDVAAWFAHRWLTAGKGRRGVKAYVATATVPLDRVAAFLTGRGEMEILIDPEWSDQIEDLKIEPAGRRPARSSVKGMKE